MSQPSLPGIAPGYEIADELDRVYTPDKLALACVKHLAFDMRRRGWPLDERFEPFVVDPSFGGGAFGRAVQVVYGPPARLCGVDIDRNAAGHTWYPELVYDDWLNVAGTFEDVDLVVGNPPFSKALDHVDATWDLQPFGFGFLLPLAYLGVQSWQRYMLGHRKPSVVYPLPARPWGDRVREVAWFEWIELGRHDRPSPILGTFEGWP